MHTTIRCLGLPKAGNSESEYEDAYFPFDTGRIVDSVVRLAVGDGASESSFSNLWARLLVHAYGEGRLDASTLEHDLVAVQTAWREALSSRKLPRHAAVKMRSGAFAALAGLTLLDGTSDGDGAWTALAVGDSCLFHRRGEEILSQFPLSDSRQFHNAPCLLASLAEPCVAALAETQTARGSFQKGDIFYLMTDAFACWFLGELERGGSPWKLVDDAANSAAFADLIADLRVTRRMKNDDVTLVRASID